jgi:phage baseplate assembly protein gpV
VFLDQTNTKITISSDGEVDISGTERITLAAPYVNISGDFVNIKGTTTITGALTQVGATKMNGAVNINGVTVADGDVTMNGAVTINGGASVTGALLLSTPPVVA